MRGQVIVSVNENAVRKARKVGIYEAEEKFTGLFAADGGNGLYPCITELVEPVLVCGDFLQIPEGLVRTTVADCLYHIPKLPVAVEVRLGYELPEGIDPSVGRVEER